MKKIKILAIVLCTAVLVCSVGGIVAINMEKNEGEQSYDELLFQLAYAQEHMPDATDATDATDALPPSSENIATSPITPEPQKSTKPNITPDVTQDIAAKQPEVDFDVLKEYNPDIKAWIRLDGTRINYPVAQAEDNEYYLTHLFDGHKNSLGCIFMDFRNSTDFSDRNTIIYGHNMKTNTMFSALVKYKEQSFYDEHPVFLLKTSDGDYKIKLYSGYIVSENEYDVGIDYTDDEFEQFIADTKTKSVFKSDVQPTTSDKLVTLYTCTYEFTGARFVLHGVLAK